MRSRALPWSLACLLALPIVVLSSSFVSAQSTRSIRCDGRLVSKGDSAHTLRQRCGEPTFTAAYPVVRGVGARVSATSSGAARLIEEQVQWWTYADDSGKFVRLVQIRRGRVHAVNVLSDLRAPVGRKCEAVSDFQQGARVGAVYVACGAPVDRARWIEHQARERGGVAVRRTVVRERWTYDPGPGRLLRILEFANGDLVSVETAERSAD